MGYYKIGKYEVFYSDDRFAEINKPFVEQLSASDIIGLNILGIDGKPNKNAVELANIRVKKLKDDYNTLSKQDFICKWVELEFEDDNAQAIGWEIIYDYFHLHKNGRIVDLRNFDHKMKDEYSGANYTNPQGQFIGLQFMVAQNSFMSTLFSNSNLTFSLNLSSIKHIKGNLNNLEIETDSKKIILSKNIKIIDKNSG